MFRDDLCLFPFAHSFYVNSGRNAIYSRFIFFYLSKLLTNMQNRHFSFSFTMIFSRLKHDLLLFKMNSVLNRYFIESFQYNLQKKIFDQG